MQSRHIFLPGVREISPDVKWNRLVFPRPIKAQLHELVLRVTHGKSVSAQWDAKLPGVSTLFAGASGTGKSLAAEAVATSLGRALLRIDLASVVDKYIGETEKNLNALFAAAPAMEFVLFFDEADALLGRRDEVRDAHDRYAGMEMGHLLSRIEQYPGLCILAVNAKDDIDPALTRRFDVSIDFPRPNARERSRLWKKLLPPNAAIDQQIDFTLLGREFDLTGGDIHKAVMHAAFAAAADSSVINMHQLIAGAELASANTAPRKNMKVSQ